MKIFFDTNVLVAAFTTRGLCADLVRLVLAGHELVVSEFILDELQKVLAHKFGISTETVRRILDFLEDQTVVPTPKKKVPIAIRDPDDGWVLSSALDSGADILVTGDHDLLELKNRLDLVILNPRELWTTLKGRRN